MSDISAKLKALKVNDLKQILQKASVSVPAKTNKADLIARILASPTALDAYNAQYPSETANDDLLAPPEEVDWNVEDVPPAQTKEPEPPASPPKPAEPPAPASRQNPVEKEEPSTSSTAPEDPELEKRKKRAERFGIALVEPKQPLQKKTSRNKSDPKTTLNEDSEKLKTRAERFGIVGANADVNKRKRTEEAVDPEEQEKRRKRAERFGIKT
ncbi:hypothetical protein K435DRAFT_743445 [Dendrothele bispora CBS 962.96]|uniref:Uncharacterized protein n=1 Tax=Dendrothele bispora (strain CBS 962.96) TaxID=1314807 RepID=A0A4S8LGP5_DENBC|nr:hypothetical protein K435DRAFT_730527 [Dendrothele bispora CBS 962.96]THV06817.1 hypothetical protein K435DRAFT_743445 [Dendrothele bispora CBS 962.96]